LAATASTGAKKLPFLLEHPPPPLSQQPPSTTSIPIIVNFIASKKDWERR
jgi:hypothetical protein